MKRIINELAQNDEELNKIKIHPMVFRGVDAWFTDERVKLHEDCSLFKYEVRSDDDGCGYPVEVSTKILVNFYGTILSENPIELLSVSLTGLPYENILSEEDFNIKFNEYMYLSDLFERTILNNGSKYIM